MIRCGHCPVRGRSGYSHGHYIHSLRATGGPRLVLRARFTCHLLPVWKDGHALKAVHVIVPWSAWRPSPQDVDRRGGVPLDLDFCCRLQRLLFFSLDEKKYLPNIS